MVIRKMKQWLALFVIIVIFTVWMIFSTGWIARLRNAENLIHQKPIEFDLMGLSFFSVSAFEKIDSVYDTYLLRGWVYNISYASDAETTRSMILSSPEISYVMQLDESYINAFTLFAEIDMTPKEYTCFGVEFCPLGIKDGSYKMILQVEEYGDPVTRIPTGYVFEKVSGNTSLVYKPSILIEPITDVKDWANAGFREFRLQQNGNLTLAGWSIVDGVEVSDQTEVYVEVFSGDRFVGTFSTVKENITYLDDHAAGFRALIPGVASEDILINVFAKYNGDYYRCSYHFEPDESMTSLVSVLDVG